MKEEDLKDTLTEAAKTLGTEINSRMDSFIFAPQYKDFFKSFKGQKQALVIKSVVGGKSFRRKHELILIVAAAD